jgi:hypothetical protein
MMVPRDAAVLRIDVTAALHDPAATVDPTDMLDNLFELEGQGS